MAHTPRLSGFSHAFTAAPLPTHTAPAPEDDVAALDRAAARIQPSWAHLIGPRPDSASPSSLMSSRREGLVRQPGDVAAEVFAARRASAAVRRRTSREDDSLAEFPRAVRSRRSAAFWLALVALAALGVAWALSDEPSSKRETRATTSPESPLPTSGAASPADSPAERRASIMNEGASSLGSRAPAQASTTTDPGGAASGLAAQGSAVTPTARAASLPAPSPSAQVDARGLGFAQNRRFMGGPAAGASAISAPAVVRGAAVQGTGLNAKPAMLARPLPARSSKFGRPGAVAGGARGASPAETTVVKLKAEAAQATAELTMQVEPVGQPMSERPQRPAVGGGAIGTNPYDDEL